MLPTFNLCGKTITRLVCGGNPFSGFSHVTSELDREMIEYYTMPTLQTILDDIPGGPKSPHLCLIRRMAYNAHKHATDLCIFLTDGPTIAPTNGDGQ